MGWRRSRTVWWSAVVLLSALMIVLSIWIGRTVYFAVKARSEREAPVAQRTIPDTDINPYGANFFLGREVEPWKIDKTLQLAADAGLGWVKLQVPWEQIEPERKGEYSTADA